MACSEALSVIPIERVAPHIHVIRGENVMLDADLAVLYGVDTGHLVRAMKRKEDRVPATLRFNFRRKSSRT
jgi:hypothetical protein